MLFLSSLLSCSTVLCLFDYVVLFWADKCDDDNDDDDDEEEEEEEGNN